MDALHLVCEYIIIIEIDDPIMTRLQLYGFILGSCMIIGERVREGPGFSERDHRERQRDHSRKPPHHTTTTRHEQRPQSAPWRQT